MNSIELTLIELNSTDEIEARIRHILTSFDYEVIDAMRNNEPGGVTRLLNSIYFQYRIGGEEVVLNNLKIAVLERLAGPLEDNVFHGHQLEKSLKFSRATASMINAFFEKYGTARWTDPDKDGALVTLDLNIFDDCGDLVDGTTANMTVAQLSDIVDNASQLILMRRSGLPLDTVLNELDEALSIAAVIASKDGE